MKKVKIEKYHKAIFHKIGACYLQHYSFNKSYYENLKDPEYKEFHGRSIESEYFAAERDLREQKANVKYTEEAIQKVDGDATLIFMDYTQTIEAIKQVIRDAMRWAYDYSSNKYIVRRGYKTAVTALNLLILNEPEFSGVTARFFINYNNLN